MIFGILVIVLVGLVVYFHYLQGFFSAGISAVLTVIAAMVAIGYHEVLVNSLLGGRLAAQAHAIALVCMFAGTYIVLRLIFDRGVPGNVRFPVLLDKIGSAVSGVVAGIFSVGILVIAAQSLPFGPSIAGYARYPINFDMAAVVHDKSRSVDATFDAVDEQRFIDNEPQKLIIPVDDIVISLAEHVTQKGAALSSGNPLSSVHPDYLQELFGQRIGLQPAASSVAQIQKSLEITGVYAAQSLPQDDQERWVMGRHAVGVRGPDSAPPPPPLQPVLKAGGGKVLLVVRARLDAGAMEKKSGMVNFGPANVRLVAGGRNYFPIGTLEGGRTLLRNAPDDYLFVPGGKAVDLVFQVDESEVLVPGENKTYQTRPGTFLEFKRLARQELPQTVTIGVPPAGELVQVVRKSGARSRGGPAVAGGEGGAGPIGTITFEGAPNTDARLPEQIGVGTPNENAKEEREWGRFELQGQRFTKIEVDPTRTVEILRQQGPPLDGLFAPQGQAVVQWTGTPQGETKWEWAEDLGNFEMVDQGNKRYKPCGVAAKVVNSNGGTMLLVRYDPTKPLASVPTTSGMIPSEVTLYWVVPSRITMSKLEYKNEVIQSFDLPTP